ncbi:MAG: AI-2E family transporter [Geminocystis sp.]|nr:AI-2E family transporter [Geminocystis sp.]HIK37723.1 AI-2E family transporter [Geminocystis sp. M7585_C2015_104]
MNFSQSLGFLAFLISLYILWEIRYLLLLIFSAVVFAIPLNRLVKKIQLYGLTRFQATVVVFFCLLFVLSLIIFLVLPPFISEFTLLLKLLPKAPNKIEELLKKSQFYNAELYQFLFQQINSYWKQNELLPTRIYNNFLALFSNVLSIVFQVIFVIVLTFVFLLNPQQYRGRVVKMFPAFYRQRISEILDKTEDSICNWLAGVTINCIFIGILSAIGLWILQVKLVLVHGLLAGLLNFIPNIGPTLSVVFPVTTALVDEPWKIIPIVVWYFIVQHIESYWLTPRVMADKVSLLPAITLFCQIFFATIFGALGLILALPLTVVAKTWIEEILFHDILDQWQLDKHPGKQKLISPLHKSGDNDG